MSHCGNPNCCASSGICGSMTFGSGELDNHGYWEYPCVICAAVTKKFSPKIDVWPEPGEHSIPEWAGQATPGAQLTCIRSAMEGTLANIVEGITSPRDVNKKFAPLMEQIKLLEKHLQHKEW